MQLTTTDIIAQLHATGREELIHFACAMHRDPAAYEMIELYLADPSAPEHVLTARRLGITARQVDDARQSYDAMARARLSTDYYGADGWPSAGVPAVTTASDGVAVRWPRLYMLAISSCRWWCRDERCWLWSGWLTPEVHSYVVVGQRNSLT